MSREICVDAEKAPSKSGEMAYNSRLMESVISPYLLDEIAKRTGDDSMSYAHNSVQ